jgi:hypothetical protein
LQRRMSDKIIRVSQRDQQVPRASGRGESAREHHSAVIGGKTVDNHNEPLTL